MKSNIFQCYFIILSISKFAFIFIYLKVKIIIIFKLNQKEKGISLYKNLVLCLYVCLIILL